jgi:hypothetical protein
LLASSSTSDLLSAALLLGTLWWFWFSVLDADQGFVASLRTLLLSAAGVLIVCVLSHGEISFNFSEFWSDGWLQLLVTFTLFLALRIYAVQLRDLFDRAYSSTLALFKDLWGRWRSL